jgi:DeoR family transcriptional regulator of aga operon
MIRSSDRVVLLADSSKFTKKAMTKICEWGSVHVLITDDGIPEQQHEMLIQRGIDVRLATAANPADADGLEAE